MFDMFQKDKETRPADVKTIRDSLLRFIKEQLQKVEGGEGSNIKALQLFVACKNEEKHMYESALSIGEEDKFKNEVQKIADDFAIDLPEIWALEVEFTDSYPEGTIKTPEVDAALFIQTRKRSLQKFSAAFVKVINGETEKNTYAISSTDGRINIGREKHVQTDSGFFRTNQIAFSATNENPANKYVSRQHAHIEYNNETGSFILFADEGGVPPKNKVKVLSSQDPNPVKLFSIQVGHTLREGDQIMLGGSAILEFSYIED
jgi:hypothetical protein